MRTLIITGGTIEDDFAKQYIQDHHWDMIISADHGLDFCHRADVLPDMILGDFDSANEENVQYYRVKCPERIRQFPAHKDETDTELAILTAMEQGASEITVLGATGTRMDHVLGNIQMLKRTMEEHVACYLVDVHNRIRMICQETILRKTEQFGTYVSLIPFTEQVTGLTLKGFAYNVSDFTLESGKARGVSNEIVEEEAAIAWKEGILLLIESRDYK